jgi:hypothetical protein
MTDVFQSKLKRAELLIDKAEITLPSIKRHFKAGNYLMAMSHADTAALDAKELFTLLNWLQAPR